MNSFSFDCMDLIFIIMIIAVGIMLIVIEVLFVPGTTVVGVLGFLAVIYGIYKGYVEFGNTEGHIMLISSLLIALAIIVWAFRTKAWDRFSNNKAMKSRVNEEYQNQLQVGDLGKAISVLKPVGKASFNDQIVEVVTNGEYVSENKKIKIIQLKGTKIFVEPIN